MCRAAYISRSDRPIPRSLISFGDALRRLRQVIDEAGDVAEDLSSGLITLPLLLAARRDLSLCSAIQELWSSDGPATLVTIPRGLIAQIYQTEVGMDLEGHVHSIAREARAAARDLTDELRSQQLLGVLVDLKLAKFDETLPLYEFRASSARHGLELSR